MEGGDHTTTKVTIILALLLYFAPALVTSQRKHRNTAPIFALTLLLGWCVALVWAMTYHRDRTG